MKTSVKYRIFSPFLLKFVEILFVRTVFVRILFVIFIISSQIITKCLIMIFAYLAFPQVYLAGTPI